MRKYRRYEEANEKKMFTESTKAIVGYISLEDSKIHTYFVPRDAVLNTMKFLKKLSIDKLKTYVDGEHNEIEEDEIYSSLKDIFNDYKYTDYFLIYDIKNKKWLTFGYKGKPIVWAD